MNHRGTVNVLDAARRGRGRAGPAHQHREHPDPVPARRARSTRTSRFPRATPSGPYCRSKLLAENAAIAGPARLAGGGGQSDDAGRSGRSGALAADAADPGFLPGKLPAMMDCTLNLIDVRDVAARAWCASWSGGSRAGAICWAART